MPEPDLADERRSPGALVDRMVIGAVVGAVGLQLGVSPGGCALYALLALALTWLAQTISQPLLAQLLLAVVGVWGVVGQLPPAASAQPRFATRSVAWLAPRRVVVRFRGRDGRSLQTQLDPDGERAPVPGGQLIYDPWQGEVLGGEERLSVPIEGWSTAGNISWHIDQRSGWMARADRQDGRLELRDLRGGGSVAVRLPGYSVGADSISLRVAEWWCVALVSEGRTLLIGYPRELTAPRPRFEVELAGRHELLGWSEDRQRALLVRTGALPAGESARAVHAIAADGRLTSLGSVSALPAAGELRVWPDVFRYVTDRVILEEARAGGGRRGLMGRVRTNELLAPSLSPDGRRAVVVSEDGEALLIEIDGDTPPRALAGEPAPPGPRIDREGWMLWLVLACAAAFIGAPREGGFGSRLLARVGLLAIGPLLAICQLQGRVAGVLGTLLIVTLVGAGVGAPAPRGETAGSSEHPGARTRPAR